jgi:putative transposase
MGNEPLFVDIDDYYRGIFSIYEFNTTKQITIRERRLARTRFKKAIREANRGQTPVKNSIIKERDLFVEVLAFCLMPNHIHLLVRQLKEGGISRFVQKFGGYASYFKKKYGTKLKGHFFQDRFEAVHIKTNDQLKVVFVYVHTNQIALIEPKWKKVGIAKPEKVIKKVIKFVEDYKWSSYPDYIGKKNFSSLTERKFMLKVMGGEKGCKEWVEGWIKHKTEIKKLMDKFSVLALD